MQTSPLNACESGPSGDTSVDSVLYALMSIGRLLRQRSEGARVDQGTFWLLKGLSATDGLRVSELAAFANLDASTVSRHVAQLHRSGFIERNQDPDDGRAQRVAISDQGRDALTEELTRRRVLLQKSLEDWGPEELETFEALLSRFVHDIERTSEQEQV